MVQGKRYGIPYNIYGFSELVRQPLHHFPLVLGLQVSENKSYYRTSLPFLFLTLSHSPSLSLSGIPKQPLHHCHHTDHQGIAPGNSYSANMA